MSQYKTIIKDWIEIILSSLVIVFFIKTFFFTTYLVPTASMEKTICVGDKIIVKKFGNDIKRGDIIAFFYPKNEKVRMVKRVIGLPGDKLCLKDGKLYINDKLYSEFPDIEFLGIDEKSLDYVYEVRVPLDGYFVMGDNRENSKDSRFWGFVKKKEVIGKVKLVYWPLNHFRWFK